MLRRRSVAGLLGGGRHCGGPGRARSSAVLGRAAANATACDRVATVTYSYGSMTSAGR